MPEDEALCDVADNVADRLACPRRKAACLRALDSVSRRDEHRFSSIAFRRSGLWTFLVSPSSSAQNKTSLAQLAEEKACDGFAVGMP